MPVPKTINNSYFIKDVYILNIPLHLYKSGGVAHTNYNVNQMEEVR